MQSDIQLFQHSLICTSLFYFFSKKINNNNKEAKIKFKNVDSKSLIRKKQDKK